MKRVAVIVLMLGALACSQKQSPPPRAALSDFAKEVLLTLHDLKVQPGAAAFMMDLDADPDLQSALAKGLDADAKKRFQELVDKHGKNDTFRRAVVAAGGDPASCGAPKPGETDPGCEAEDEEKTPALLTPPPAQKNSKNLLDP